MEEKSPGLLSLFLFFLKIGAFGFGGPYALLLFLEKEIVHRKKWLNPEIFWEGVAVGQFTPGPVFFATAVFCGYRLRGNLGAVLAAVGHTFPAFVLSILFGYFYLHFQKLQKLHEIIFLFLAVAIGLLLSIVWRDRNKFFKTASQRIIGTTVFFLLVFFHFNPLLIMLAGGIAGAIFFAPAKES